jgi:hypothetical protein
LPAAGFPPANLASSIEPRWRAPHRAGAFLGHVVDFQPAESGLDALFPHAALLGGAARLVLDRHHFLGVSVPEVRDGSLLSRQGRLVLGFHPFGPGVGLGLIRGISDKAPIASLSLGSLRPILASCLLGCCAGSWARVWRACF